MDRSTVSFDMKFGGIEKCTTIDRESDEEAFSRSIGDDLAGGTELTGVASITLTDAFASLVSAVLGPLTLEDGAIKEVIFIFLVHDPSTIVRFIFSMAFWASSNYEALFALVFPEILFGDAATKIQTQTLK